jgi:hypothetical protein
VWAILHYTSCGQVEEVRLKNKESEEKKRGMRRGPTLKRGD